VSGVICADPSSSSGLTCRSLAQQHRVVVDGVEELASTPILQTIAEDNIGFGIDTDKPGRTIRSGPQSLQCQPVPAPEVHGSASGRHRQRGSEVLVAFRSEHTATISVGRMRLRDQLAADQPAEIGASRSTQLRAVSRLSPPGGCDRERQ